VLFLLKFLNFLAPGSGIRIPNTDPDPQPWSNGSTNLDAGLGKETGTNCRMYRYV
jgi:hypothetical protein